MIFMKLGSKADFKYALAGGGIAFVIIVVGSGLLGGLSGYKPIQLVKATLPHIRSLCGTFILALGTMLALMLTFLSFSGQLEVDMEWGYFKRIQEISLAITITLIAAVVVYLLLNIPIVKTEFISENWYMYLYYAVISVGAFLGGAFVAIVLFLYRTISGVVAMFNPNISETFEANEE